MGSEELSRLVKPHQRYAYDLVVYVGLARYLRGKQREEIRAELYQERGVRLSEGSISNLCDRFLGYFEALHLARVPELRGAMEPGYPLHLDATCEHGKGGLFVCMDGWRGWVLMAARIPSEHEDYLRPWVEKTAVLFGAPIATVRDMGEGVGKAVAPLRARGVPDFICHYHFLGRGGQEAVGDAVSRLGQSPAPTQSPGRFARLAPGAAPVSALEYLLGPFRAGSGPCGPAGTGAVVPGR